MRVCVCGGVSVRVEKRDLDRERHSKTDARAREWQRGGRGRRDHGGVSAGAPLKFATEPYTSYRSGLGCEGWDRSASFAASFAATAAAAKLPPIVDARTVGFPRVGCSSVRACVRRVRERCARPVVVMVGWGRVWWKVATAAEETTWWW